jgi:hypothetical protein
MTEPIEAGIRGLMHQFPNSSTLRRGRLSGHPFLLLRTRALTLLATVPLERSGLPNDG